MKDLKGKKVLIIQTAFIGDVILATSLIETLKSEFPDLDIHFLLRKGNETLLQNNPNVSKVMIWDKIVNKYQDLSRIIRDIRRERYDVVFNLQRFFSTGLITTFSGAKLNVGFNKNPLSIFFGKSKIHKIGEGLHEIDRNVTLVEDFTNRPAHRPRLYTDQVNKEVKQYQMEPYICMAPSSVWFTKQFPESKWIELIKSLRSDYKIYLLGGPGDKEMCNRIISVCGREGVQNLSGKLSFLESAALMKGAEMNYVNDSAPLHMASAVNAPTMAIFCSTIPEFGFGPLSDKSKVIQVPPGLACRPCGIHGRKNCPELHFKCGNDIDIISMID